MAEYNPSKIIKDGNTYNFRDTTKIPLAGTNALAGSIVPDTDNAVDIGDSSKNIKMIYTKGITINGTQFLPSDYATLSGLSTVATSGSYNDLSNKPTIPTVNNGTLTIQKNGTTVDTFTANSSSDKTVNISVPTNTSELTNGAGYITADYAVPRSGGSVMTGTILARTTSSDEFGIYGGTGFYQGGAFIAYGKDHVSENGGVVLHPCDGSNQKYMWLYADGTWIWQGQAVQLISDKRFKQQITEIDDKLLDAWEDVDLVQFKYNDAVDQKGKDKARLHTGYVVQQIDSACKSHNVDISEYGLYCHEEYPEETDEVEVEQADGTKVKEKKVIREASEHYSLRYTEVYAVECMYLRRCIARLTARIEELEKGNNTK